MGLPPALAAPSCSAEHAGITAHDILPCVGKALTMATTFRHITTRTVAETISNGWLLGEATTFIATGPSTLSSIALRAATARCRRWRRLKPALLEATPARDPPRRPRAAGGDEPSCPATWPRRFSSSRESLIRR